jgi:hypothetical protein
MNVDTPQSDLIIFPAGDICSVIKFMTFEMFEKRGVHEYMPSTPEQQMQNLVASAEKSVIGRGKPSVTPRPASERRVNRLSSRPSNAIKCQQVRRRRTNILLSQQK